MSVQITPNFWSQILLRHIEIWKRGIKQTGGVGGKNNPLISNLELDSPMKETMRRQDWATADRRFLAIKDTRFRHYVD
jgi:hypothetical protein